MTLPDTAAFNRALDAWLTPPDDTIEVCECRHEMDDHNAGGGCLVCGDCDGFEPYDEHRAREDHEFELADIAWKERDSL